MKHLVYKFGITIMTVALVWSCSKDDGPSKPTPDPEPTNNAPTMSAQSFEVPESITDAEEIGEVAASDTDEGDVLTFTIADNELFEITEAGSLSLKAGKALNFEAKPNYEVSVSVTDSEGETASATITITVTDVAEADPEDKAAFVTTWQTDAANETIYIGLNNEYDYSFTINWGDGTVEDIAKTQDPEGALYIAHEYATADTHDVSIIGEFPAIQMYVIYPDNPDNGLELNLDPAPKEGYGLVGIKQWGAIQWQTMIEAFSYATILEDYSATDAPDLSQVTDMDMSYMFREASLFNADLNNWDVSSVVDMKRMFSGADAFNGDISGWTTGNVTNMNAMFFGAKSFNGDISGWNVSSVTNMQSMFDIAFAFNKDLSNWDVSLVNTMSQMFSNAKSFNQDLSAWKNKLGSVTSMFGMFNGAVAFNGDISGWDVSSVTNMAYMFSGATSFNRNLGAWNIGNLEAGQNTGMDGMFNNSGMTATSINATLIGWADFAAQNDGPKEITCGMQGMTVCGPEATDAGGYLQIEHSWGFPGVTVEEFCF